MKSSKILVIFSLAVVSTCLAQEFLNEQTVEDFARTIQDSIIFKNADGLASAFTQSATIVVEMPKNAGGVISYDKERFIGSVKRGWSDSQVNYSYQVQDTRIQIAEDGMRATLNFVTKESAESGGNASSDFTSLETMEIVVTEDGPKVESYYSKVGYSYSDELRANLEQGIYLECVRDMSLDNKSKEEADRFCPCMANIVVENMSDDDIVAGMGGDQAIFNSIIFENVDEISQCEATNPIENL